MRALYLDKRDDDHYTAAMERLCVQTEPPAPTAGILKRTLRELEAPTGLMPGKIDYAAHDRHPIRTVRKGPP